MESESVNSRLTNISQTQENDDNNSFTSSFPNCLPTESVSSKCSRFLESMNIYKNKDTEKRQEKSLHENKISSAPKKTEVETCNRFNTMLNIRNIEKSEFDIIRKLLSLFYKRKDCMSAGHTEDSTEKQQINVTQTDSALDTMHEDTATSATTDEDNSIECAAVNVIQNDVCKIDEEKNICHISNRLPQENQNISARNNTNTEPVLQTTHDSTRRSLSMTLRDNPRKVSRSKFETLVFAYNEDKEGPGKMGSVKRKKRRRLAVNSVYPKQKRRKLFSMESWLVTISHENEEK